MITDSAAIRQVPAWQRELAGAVTDPAELARRLGLSARWLTGARAAARHFPLRVPQAFVDRMRHGDTTDPLLRQVLPLADELETHPGFTTDPVGDGRAHIAPGVLKKYYGRALLITTGACAIHCRYCFRRHFPYSESNAMADAWDASLTAVRADASINEVILSGGDPLAVSDRRLATLVQALGDIAHVRTLRIHTRLPIVLPARVDDLLLAWLGGSRLRVVVVVHANHANEIDDSVRAALGRLCATGTMLLNQSVLLRGVNDHADALADLSHALFDAGVLPYYLHLLDRVAGAAHFEVPEVEAHRLYDRLRTTLPGYLVPRLVRETEGATAKTLVLR